ncbi:MAG TPA: sigma-70 family RNA polymerase sigma factor [Pyrinomonadaceae bacterium]|nr:sigma-70 family RNA polymerase sigma factor [Pyrinomonadaceae bacterium]
MDNLLLPYLRSQDQSQTQQTLEELLTLYAVPIIRRTLRDRLGFYVSAQGVSEFNQDAEDLYQETMTRIVQRLAELRAGAAPEIENFRQYVARVSTNLCIDFLRAKAPMRAHLKDSLRDLLKRHKELAAWEEKGEILCGLSIWKNSTGTIAFNEASLAEITAREFAASRFKESDLQPTPLSKLVIELLSWIGQPVHLEGLVKLLTALLRIREPEYDSVDNWDTNLADDSLPGDSELQGVELLKRLWQALQLLPQEQRAVFILGFEDDAGQDLFTALLVAHVARLKEIAEVMALTIPEVIRLRLEMPMDTTGIAARLKTSRTNISKWRFRALRRLRTELQQ